MRWLLLPFALSIVFLLAWRLPAVEHLNDPPVARDDSISIEVDGPSVRIDVLLNDTDADGDPLVIDAITMEPTKGDVIINSDESLQYLSTTSDPATDTFTYRISDGNGGTDEATVKVFLIANDPPTAIDDEATLFSHEVIDIDVLLNDTDPEGEYPTIISLPRLPLHGKAEIVLVWGALEEQRVRYDPDDDYEGLDSLLYEIADSFGKTDTAQVVIDVKANQRPVAVDDQQTALINASIDIDVLLNDTDAEGDPLTISSIPKAPENGTTEIIGEGTLILYTPNSGFLGNDTFDYIVSDGIARTNPPANRATVFIEVIPPDRNFVAVLSGAGVLPPVETRATGRIDASLDGNNLTFSGAFSRLGSEVVADVGMLVQLGLAGQNGELLFPLNVDLGLDMRSGSLTRANNTFALSNAEVNALFTRRMYVNVLTEALPGGEIRGQLLPDGTDEIFRAVFSGRAAVPANDSGALGGAVAELFGDILVINGAFSGLESTFVGGGTGARLHQGFIGANGEIVRVLNVDLDNNRIGGTIEQADNRFVLTNEEIQLLENKLLYIAIGTNDARDGEIRGQLLPLSTRTFEAALSGDNEVPPVPSSGSGGLIATIEGTTLTLGGTLNGLTSGVDLTLRNGANIHQGAPNENGEILFDLLPFLDLESGRRSGVFLTGSNQFTLTPPQLAALFDGQLYVNIHTDDDPEGEVRGQLLSSPNVPPIASSISSPENNATVVLSGDPTTPFKVRWRTAPDPNGNTTYYRWQLAQISGFGSLIYQSDLTTETELTTTFGALGTAMTAAGISTNTTVTLFHRVVSTDGGLATLGPALRLIVTRGVLTGLEENAVPEHFAVLGNYPNPFNPVTTVHVDLPQAARVQVEVYDVLGRRVLTMPAQHLEAGARRALTVDADRLTSGLYLYRVVALTDTGTLTGTGRMIVVK